MMRALRFLFVVLMLASPAFAQDHPLRGVALVIGESNYAGLPELANPKSDARAIDEMLGDLGFDVTRVLDGDQKKLESEIADFIDAAKDADVALVYYSGHGIEAGGENYLAPIDVDLSTPERAGATLIPVSAMLDQLAKTVPVTILLLDACRTNGFAPGTMIQPPGATAPVPAVEAGLAAVRGPTPVGRSDTPANSLGMVIGFAAGPGQSALDGAPGEDHSPYAAALLKHLGAGGYSFADVMTMVSEEVYLKTRAQQLPWVNSSLRRVLSFGTPIEDRDPDETAIRDGRRELLLSIAAEPLTTRATIESIATSQGVPLDALYGMLKVLGVDTTGNDLEKQLQEGAKQLKLFKEQELGTAASDPELKRLGDLAARAQDEGAMDLALKYREQATARARVLSGERDQLEANLKADRIEIAATFAEHAQTAVLNFDYATAAQMFGEAYEEVAKWDDVLALKYKRDEADALDNQGYFRADNDSLVRAIAAYGEALKLVDKATQAADWSAIEGDLGDTLFSLGERENGTASLDLALETLKAAIAAAPADTKVADLAEMRMNLGNVLITLGQRDTNTTRLEAGVVVFRQILTDLPQATDPQLWGNVQLNLAGSLRLIADREAGTETLIQSLAAFEAGIAALDKAKWPFDWAQAQNNYATALVVLGQRTHNAPMLRKAADALNAALTIQLEAVYPLDWAMSQSNLGNVYAALFNEGEGDATTLQQSLDAFRAALRQMTREKVPLLWATAQNNIGVALSRLAGKTGDRSYLSQAVEAFRLALEERKETVDPLGWAIFEVNLADALQQLGDSEVNPANVREAVADAEAALKRLTKADEPTLWARGNLILGKSLKSFGDKIIGDIDNYKLAAEAFLRAQEVFTREADPDNWSLVMRLRGDALVATGEPDQIKIALGLYAEVQATIDRTADAFAWGQVENSVAGGYAVLGDATNDKAAYQQARDHLETARKVLVPFSAGLDAQYVDFIKLIDEKLAAF